MGRAAGYHGDFTFKPAAACQGVLYRLGNVGRFRHAAIAKLAAGICDDVVSLTACALPRSTPVLLAPAMNEQMWENPITQGNVSTVKQILGYHTVGPAEGWQACRTAGAGRMSEPQQIIAAAAAIAR